MARCLNLGDYVNNKKEGNGIFWWTTGSHAGDRYEGQFENDQRLFCGTFWYHTLTLLISVEDRTWNYFLN